MATAGAHPRDAVAGSAVGAFGAAERPLAPPIQLLRHGRRTRRTKRFDAIPGTTFILPREDIELVERWALVDPHLAAILQAMRADLADGSPAGRLYGESLANALAVYLAGRYGAGRAAPTSPKGGMPGRRLRKVLDYIGENLTKDLCVKKLASIAGMSPHYFSELFRKSVGRPPHQYVLRRRIERAKESLRNPERSVLEAGLSAGFENPSHFARAFRRLVGATPRQFRAG